MPASRNSGGARGHPNYTAAVELNLLQNVLQNKRGKFMQLLNSVQLRSQREILNLAAAVLYKILHHCVGRCTIQLSLVSCEVPSLIPLEVILST